MITPTVGRQVWFRGRHSPDFTMYDPRVPCAATVIYVWSERCVNLDVIDHAGKHHVMTSVLLVQEGDSAPAPDSIYAEWMPYQKGQAAKTEAAEAKAAGG